MKNLRIIAMTALAAFCVMLLGSQSDTLAQGRSGKSKGKSTVGMTRSGDAIQRGIERTNRNRTWRDRNRTRDRDWDRGRIVRSRNGDNGVRDHGRGIGRGKGQGKGRGYNKRMTRSRRPF